MGHSELRPAVHSSQPVRQQRSVPAAVLLKRGSTEDMFEQVSHGHESEHGNGIEPSRLVYQRSHVSVQDKYLIYVLGNVSIHDLWMELRSHTTATSKLHSSL